MYGSIFEATFKKYANLTLEGISLNRNILTDEQNACLKQLYIIIRDCIEDIYYECRSQKINIKNCDSRFPTFLGNYVPKNPYISVYNYETLKLQVPNKIKECFKDLTDELKIKIVSKEKPILKSGKGVIAKAGLDRDHKNESIIALYIRFDILIDDINELKAGLQHELQHIHSRSKVLGLKNGESKIHGFIEYLGDDSEIAAYSKEYAYRYHKKYPRDTELSIDKLKKLFNNKKSESFNHYMLFGEDGDTIRDKVDVSLSDIKKMNKIYSKFTEAAKNSLKYFL